MLYDLKIIMKKSKPVLWYELEVPGGITFSVLSVFLDIVSGTKDAPPSGFMFELPSFEVQLREGIFLLMSTWGIMYGSPTSRIKMKTPRSVSR